jgi:hypothetical protein
MRSVLALVTTIALAFGTLAFAASRKPEDVFGGRILVSDQPFLTAAPTAEAYIGAMKKNARDRIKEDREAKQWRVFFAAFFKQAPNDLEISVRVYDVTNGARRLVSTFEQYLGSATMRAYVSQVTLPRGDGTGGYDPNTKIQMVMDSHGRVLAETTFYIVGEVKKGPTNIDFSDPAAK